MNLLNSFVLLGGAILCIAYSCANQKDVVPWDPGAAYFEKLSDYQLFKKPIRQLIPNDRVLPYDLITPLFSDYADKARFVWMPENQSAALNNDGSLSFPEGSILVKNFYYENNGAENKAHKNIETRLLIKNREEWEPLTYVWNDEQSEAFLEIAGEFKEVTASDPSGAPFTIDYVIPNKNQCKGCHEKRRKLTPVGPKLGNLNRDYPYPEGKQNQLVKWSEVHYLTGYDSSRDTLRMADWTDEKISLHERALAYLEVNCGTCHHPEGPANVSGLRLTTEEKNLFNLGVLKAPVSAGKGSGGHRFDIVPGNPDESILVYRMESIEPGAMMPELGRKLVHKEGVQLIRDWISAMPLISEN